MSDWEELHYVDPWEREEPEAPGCQDPEEEDESEEE